MKSFTVALAALAARAVADSTVAYNVCDGNCGQAKIISHCEEEIYFQNVPSMGATVGETCFKQGSTYEQTFTAMPNGAGWSMKLSPDPSFPGDNTQQYEYTWQGGDDPVWYDMSYVNGNPYTSWNFTSSDVETCNPTDHAYRSSTDDVYGMQASCAMSVTLTLHLCPENAGSYDSSSSSGSSSGSSSSSSAAATSSSAAPTSTFVAPTSYSQAPSSTLATVASSSSAAASNYGSYGNKNVQVDQSGNVAEVASPSATTAVVTSADSNGVIVTETQVQVVTQVQTMVVTARDAAPTAHAHKLRHEHRHPHGSRA